MRDNKFETRSVSEFRADDDGPGISGYAANFLTVDSFGSVFSRSAFKKTVRERGDRIPLLYNHNRDQLIGKVTELRSDQKGLKFKAKVVEGTSVGSDVMALVRAEVLQGMSFGFRSIKERPGLDTDGIDMTTAPTGTKPGELRFIEETMLQELSPVPFPSNPRSQIESFRSESDADSLIEEVLDTIRSAELTPEQIERIETEIRSLRDTNYEEPPDGTPDEEIRRQIENENIDIDLLLLEISKL